MVSSSQRRASETHRNRVRGQGLVRLEVQAVRADTDLIRALAKTLRSDPDRADVVRAALVQALCRQDLQTALDVFGSDLPEAAFDGVFDPPAVSGWSEVDL